ncbi:nuclear transport factor 2 family protein [uncultured Pseudacidovorax sp.]|uniref:nuclear transport factor 2 family protein n=1 Tax=uncultured Pseudacidovorax sp. TaxID=679313 RepID=UPI0025ED941B|nr:nuclear transport factor 2 family protein [uncultured Pseudacidovorax sp.]
MKTTELPQPITAYFAADRQDPDAVGACFTADATVTDEGRTHAGRAAIRAWKAAASTQYRYTVEPFALEARDDVCTVTAHVRGDFPGSPVDLRYRFRLAQGLIASLEIGV